MKKRLLKSVFGLAFVVSAFLPVNNSSAQVVVILPDSPEHMICRCHTSDCKCYGGNQISFRRRCECGNSSC